MKESLVSGEGQMNSMSNAFADYIANRRGVPQISEDPNSNQARMVRSTSDASLTSSEGGTERGEGRQELNLVAQCMGELDDTLREILDTVMSEAMA